MGGLIDGHVHVWADDPARFPWRPLNGGQVPAIRGDAEWLLDVLARSGVARVVAVQPRVYGDDHSYLVSVVAGHPDSVIGVGYVDPASTGVGERVAYLVDAGLRGLRLDPLGDRGEWLGARSAAAGWGAAAVWEAAARHHLPIELLVGGDQLDRLTPLLNGWPEVVVIVEHMALWTARRPLDVTPLVALAHHANLRVKASALAGISDEPPPHRDVGPLVERVASAFGADRMMWGSDMPWIGEDAYPAAVETAARLLPLEADRDHLLGGTAGRTFDRGRSDA